jgi:cytochrome P450
MYGLQYGFHPPAYVVTAVKILHKTLHFLGSASHFFVQNTVGDIPWLAWNPERFITTDLYARAEKTGVAQAYIGPRWLCYLGYAPTITIVSGDRALVSQVTNYDDEDPESRRSFDIVQQISGFKSIVNTTGEKARVEREKIKKFLAGSHAVGNAYDFTLNLISKYFAQWNPDVSVQDHITYISANVIGRCVFGIPHVPIKYAKILQQAGRLVVHPRPPVNETARIAAEMRKMSDDVMSNPEAAILQGYPFMQITLNGSESTDEILAKLKQTNAGAYNVVEGNLSFLMLSGLLMLSQHPEVVTRLREELAGFDWSQSKASDALCRLTYLDCVYHEILRHPSPTGMLDRQVSRPFKIKGREENGNTPVYSIAGNSIFSRILGNSHMVVCVSSIHHDARFWKKPHTFDPSRFEGEEGQNRKKHLMPFSIEKRSCPAGSVNGTGFAATVGKLVIAYFVTNYDLHLKSKLQPVPHDSFYRRFEEVFAEVKPAITQVKKLRMNEYIKEF